MVRYRRPGETESLAHHTYRCRAPTRPTPTCPGSICYSDMHNCTITPEQETTLRNAYTELQAQGSYVSGRMLASFYEFYRGYTIYGTEQGRCCIHGKEGCLRIQGKYACFPDTEQAKTLIKHFQADGRTSQESMNRYVPEDEYICLNGSRQRNEHSIRYRLARA